MNNLDTNTDRIVAVGVALAFIGGIAALALKGFPEITNTVLTSMKTYITGVLPK
ncbi:hypothetical protein ACFC84_17165 [Enterococcus casseliflavus]|jgi:uncharacterized membrane-anchored protein|uniref:hypothetical protein n=1 Tax=Enterococcus TaxID=1350 RepID=UPI000AB1F173|nr:MULTISPECIES: hypothetical protein [Enterococcus]MDC0753163.1 hypothetical protein [Enterococcus innesii]MDC0777252.1 hypothetical protein [Enterococcus innesii]MDC0780634.1 hypothetical protein [Enterococcus innesii]MDC0783997.1 hypothetical protein [Enterococcus innesii]VTS13226.1 Uncharacterised protein [Enterococcus casseliflavus]